MNGLGFQNSTLNRWGMIHHSWGWGLSSGPSHMDLTMYGNSCGAQVQGIFPATLTWHSGCVGLGGLNAYVLNIRGNIQDTNQGSCLINHAAEPCTHFPMKPTCKNSNASEIHSTWMRHHLRECLDHDGGLQLVVEAPQPNNSTRLWEHNH